MPVFLAPPATAMKHIWQVATRHANKAQNRWVSSRLSDTIVRIRPRLAKIPRTLPGWFRSLGGFTGAKQWRLNQAIMYSIPQIQCKMRQNYIINGIPGKTKRQKKKASEGLRRLQLIWGIFCFAEAFFVFWGVFVVILVFHSFSFFSALDCSGMGKWQRTFLWFQYLRTQSLG